MEVTNIVKGIPEEIKEKRILRIKEALSFEAGTKENPSHNVVNVVNGVEVYLNKPGKEFFRDGDAQNINDMSPGVGDYYTRYAFKDIWKDLLNISVHLSKDSYKKLFVIIYRLAFMLDCVVINDKVRFQPSDVIINEINLIQKEVDDKGIDFKVLEFLNFLDILGWNEDVKYQPDMIFDPPKKGRINNILSMISIPLIFKKFVDNVIDNRDDLENLDYSALIDMAQDFSRTRGVSPISNTALIEHLAPFLED